MYATFLPVTRSQQLTVDAHCASPGTVRVAVAGEIDLASRDVLRVRLHNVLSTLHPRRIEVDLAGVTFLDCSGLTVLVVLGQAAARSGCRLRITNPQPLVRRILELTGVLEVLTAGFGQASPAVAPANLRSVGIQAAVPRTTPPLAGSNH